jgi:protein gp37
MNDVKDSIGWADYTWNPVTGCKRGCKWGKGGCYAKKNWDRLHQKREGCEFDTIKFYPKRLKDKDLMRYVNCKIFVGSMSDPEWWTREMMEAVIQTMAVHVSRHTFMLLSKNTNSYHGYSFPANVMCGLTITGEHFGADFTNIILHKKKHHPFLSIEPLLGIIPTTDYSCFEQVIVGAMTHTGAIKPKPEWIQRIKDLIPAEKIYFKKNIRSYL